MPRHSNRSVRPVFKIYNKRRPAARRNQWKRPHLHLAAPLSLEPLEDRTLLAADLGVDLDVLAAATPFRAADLTSLDLAAFRSGGRQVPAFSGEWVVKLATEWSDGSVAESLSVAKELFGQHVDGLVSVQGLASTDTFLIRTSNDYSPSSISQALAGIDSFALVEPNYLAWQDDTIPDDPSFPDQWALQNVGQLGGVFDADIDAPLAWDVNTGSGNTVVGVVDSGVDYTHPDLDDNMWRNPGEIPGDGIDNDTNGFVDDVFGYDFINGDSDPLDDEGHGTSVAGIIAAEGNNALGVSGVNWAAQIMALKIFDPFGFAGTAQIVGAINYATMMKQDYGVDVIATNHSWGTVGFSTVLRDAIAAGGVADILFVASAGNSQHDNDVAPQYPASYDLDSIISVAATDRFDNAAGFTSFGATSVDLGAPGVSTRTTALGGGYRNFSGTSASAPYVTGVAAFVHDTFPKASALDVKQAILDGVDPIAAMAGITLTGGRLNQFGALQAMQMQVVAASPDDDDIVSAPPLEFTIETAFAIDAATVEAADLSVNGLTADGVLVDANTATFSYTNSPVTSQGAQELRIDEGAFSRLVDSSPVKEFVATFRYDVLRLEAIATVPAPGAIVPLPLNSIRIDFNEVVDALSVDTGDLVLSEGSVVGFDVIDGDTIEYQLAGIASDRELVVAIPPGALGDGFGNPNLAFSTTLEVDVDVVSAAAFERLQPLGGFMFVSHNEGRLAGAADADRFEFFVEAGQTVAVRVTPLDASASMSVEVPGLAAPVASPGPGQAAILAPTLIGGDGVVSVEITGDRTTDYRVEIFKNAAIEDPAAGPPQSIDSSAIAVGSRRFGVVGSIDSAGQTDRYTLDLTAGVGRPVDIVLAGQDGVSQVGATLELVAPSGAIVAATADPFGNGATNYDQAIFGFVPDEIGDHELRMTSGLPGQYGIVVTERLHFESEVNDGPLGHLRSLAATQGVAGFVDPFGRTGRFEFVVDTSRSSLEISGGVGTSEQGVLVPFGEQAPGSLQSDLRGTVQAIISSDSIELLPEATIFAFEKPGPFQPGNAPADFAASLDAPPIFVGGAVALRDTALAMVGGGLDIDGSGNFAADQLSFSLRAILAASIPAVFNEIAQIDDTFIDNESTTPGSLRLVDGRFELTLPIHVRIFIPAPQLPVAGIFDYDGQVVATAIVPGVEDEYSLTLAPGQTVSIETRTPFDDSASSPGNSLNPAIELLDGLGAVVVADADSAMDGKNARLEFTSETGGTYKIRVLGTAGRGEYVLDINENEPPELDPIGNRTVSEGRRLQFTAHAADPDLDDVTYSLAPGAPEGATIDPTSGEFEWRPQDDPGSPFAITVIATDNGSPQMSDRETISVTVENVAPTIRRAVITPSAPTEGETVSLSAAFTDPGILDTHTAVVDWGDGSSSPVKVSRARRSSEFVANHVYSSGGIYTVIVTVADDDGGVASRASSLLVAGVGIHERGGQRILEIVGTSGNDYVSVTPRWGNRLNVFASFLPGPSRTLSLAGLDLIKVVGLGGDDFLGVGSIDVPALIDGGNGNDTLRGGNGGNVLIGGRGNDVLYGGRHRDILIGGKGADSLFGNSGQDILIGGYTSYDTPAIGARQTNDSALLALLREWKSPRSYSQRTANISDGIGPVLGSSGIRLTKGLTVFDDSHRDRLYGGASLDWYFADFRDALIIRTAGEKLNN